MSALGNQQEESPFTDVEISDDDSVSTLHCIDHLSTSANVFLILCFIGMVLFNNIMCALSGPDTLSQSSMISLPKRSRKKIQLTFLVKDISPEHNVLDVFFTLTRSKSGAMESKELEKKMTITLIDDLKETTLECNKKSKSTITFPEGSKESKKVPLFRKKIDNFDAVEIMFDLENNFSSKITNATLTWTVDSQMKRPKTSASQIMQFTILFFSFVSLLLNVPANYFDIYTLILIFIGLFSMNPFMLFIPDVESIQLLSPILSSVFVCVFRIYIFVDLLNYVVTRKVISRKIIISISSFLIILALIDMQSVFSNHFSSIKLVMGSKLVRILAFIGGSIHLIALIMTTLSAIKKSQSAMLHLTMYTIAILSNVSKLIAALLEIMKFTEFTLYRDISIVNSNFVIATCFFSFFRLSVRKSPMDGMVIIKSDNEKN